MVCFLTFSHYYVLRFNMFLVALINKFRFSKSSIHAIFPVIKNFTLQVYLRVSRDVSYPLLALVLKLLKLASLMLDLAALLQHPWHTLTPMETAWSALVR